MPKLKQRLSKADHEDDDDSGGLVRTVVVAAKVLDAISEFRGPVRLTDLARMLKMTLPRISRHVATMRMLGFIEKAEPLEAYRLGTKLFVLGQIALEQNSLASVAPPYLAGLRDQVNHTVMLSTRSGNGGAVLTCVPSNESPTIVVRPGEPLSYPSSPSARILQIFSGPQDALWEGKRDAYAEERSSFILANYYDFEPDARGSGIGSVAAPVFDHQDHLAGVVAVVMPTKALLEGPDPQIVKALIECTARISSTMGSKAWDRRISNTMQPERRAQRG
jgi:DNA-binding IclR family transcriptional regulator